MGLPICEIKKAKILEECKLGIKSTKEITKEYQISATTLRNWRREVEAESGFKEIEIAEEERISLVKPIIKLEESKKEYELSLNLSLEKYNINISGEMDLESLREILKVAEGKRC